MLKGCSSLEELNLTNFNTDNVNDMSYMLKVCCSLEKLKFSNFNVSNEININYMFSRCGFERIVYL